MIIFWIKPTQIYFLVKNPPCFLNLWVKFTEVAF